MKSGLVGAALSRAASTEQAWSATGVARSSGQGPPCHWDAAAKTTHDPVSAILTNSLEMH